MLFHILVGKVAKFRVNTAYRCYFTLLVGKVAKFRVNTSYRCYFTYWLEKLQNVELIHHILFDLILLRPLNNLSVMRDGLPGLNQY